MQENVKQHEVSTNEGDADYYNTITRSTDRTSEARMSIPGIATRGYIEGRSKFLFIPSNETITGSNGATHVY
ncbi:hypothetical protein CLOM_g5226 [Closterium sp. NIES-68]|nr:hypothetical protein CLOM_g5226 [Closterium sp. NIES-68]